MNRLNKIVLFLFVPFWMQSQNVFWAQDVAPIIFDNCSSCHHNSGIAPFELMTYEDAVLHSDAIHHAIDERSMPPWPADPNYRHFADETYLEQEEIDLIHQWIFEGMSQGDMEEAPDPPTFPEQGSLLDKIDYTIEIEPYTLQNNVDEYRWLVVENPFDEAVYIDKIEVIPGLDQVVHHVDLFLDESGQSLQFDIQDPLPGFNSTTGSPNNDTYINAWAPGGNITRYPENWGYKVEPNAEFVIEIHFGPGGLGMIDSTKLNLQFIEDPSTTRQVNASWLLNDSPPIMVDGPLIIPANEIVTFHQESLPLPKAISVISICPHMHFLGKSYKVWFETIEGDTVPLIDIPYWDFHWQKYYTFQKIQPIPQGAVIKSIASYDNTSANHDNPNSPPITVYRGLKTTDEMFLCFFTYAEYVAGDEDIIMDSTLLSTTPIDISLDEKNILIYPNPSHDKLFLKGNLSNEPTATFQIISIEGQVLIKQKSPLNEDENKIEFDISTLAKGLYFIQWSDKRGTYHKPFIKI